MYKVLDALGCNPDATQSERNFLDDVPASEFEMRMYDVISKAEKANKERDG